MRIITWQYLVRRLTSNYSTDELTGKLNDFGLHGFELVCIFKTENDGHNYIIFKKPTGYISLDV